MKSFLGILFGLCFNYVVCRDFYVGMFKKNDLLVAQDNMYKERVPYRAQFAKYGRYFKCPITYFRVVDRLGVGRGPKVEVIRGGLLKKYIVLRLTSAYNQPISVNIYVGCENKISTTKRPTTTTKKVDTNKAKTETTTGGSANEITTPAGDDNTGTKSDTDGPGGDDTTAGTPAEGGETTAPAEVAE